MPGGVSSKERRSTEEGPLDMSARQARTHTQHALEQRETPGKNGDAYHAPSSGIANDVAEPMPAVTTATEEYSLLSPVSARQYRFGRGSIATATLIKSQYLKLIHCYSGTAWNIVQQKSYRRSLLLVSRAIHAVAKEHALRSIAIYGPDNLRSFARFLESRPPRLRRVEHLLISHSRQSFLERPDSDIDSKKWKWPWERTRLQQFRLFVDSDGRDPSPSVILPHILDLVSPSLRTLTLLLSYRYLLPASVTLPVLTELTCRTGHLNFRVHQFPALRRLHLLDDRYLTRNFLSHLAPSLTHLRISDIALCTESVLYDTVVALIEEGKKHESIKLEELHPHKFPPALRKVLLLFKPAIFTRSQYHRFMNNRHEALNIQSIVGKDLHHRIKVLCLWTYDVSVTTRRHTRQPWTSIRSNFQRRAAIGWIA
ncbi:hypothetical protein A0H81_06475 [Grifola frondosa]|uniref:Uncharacterized protein n=1 Tax=Grifola frondosa TaxID=5627 RepID=A0A1C7MCE2_GRIFR|nr:hypothetical protein A0H81_06475 [Grifola frondosa]